jgi:hypothetical protein
MARAIWTHSLKNERLVHRGCDAPAGALASECTERGSPLPLGDPRIPNPLDQLLDPRCISGREHFQ